MPPLRGGIGVGVDSINHPFAPGLPPGRPYSSRKQAALDSPAPTSPGRRLQSTLEATQGQISSQSPTDDTSGREVAIEWDLTTQTMFLPLGCLQGGVRWNSCHSTLPATRIRGDDRVNRKCFRALFEPPHRAGGLSHSYQIQVRLT